MTTQTNARTTRTRALRQAANPAERALWAALKSRQLEDYKFTRQLPIGPYFADFACRAHNMVIELDGSQHQDQQTYDRTRDEYMIAAGYSVFRVPSASVLQDRAAVCDTILAVLENRIEDFVEAHDLRFQRSYAKPMRRGFSSHHALRQSGG